MPIYPEQFYNYVLANVGADEALQATQPPCKDREVVRIDDDDTDLSHLDN